MVAAGLQPGKEGERQVSLEFQRESGILFPIDFFVILFEETRYCCKVFECICRSNVGAFLWNGNGDI